MKPRIVIIGAGMAGLAAANKLYTSTHSKQLLDLTVVEGGSRIGGRINSSEFCGDGIEQGATWIHGIEGSPIYKIAQEGNLLHSPRPWEWMDGNEISHHPITVAEGGHELGPSCVGPISGLFKNLMDFIHGKAVDEDGSISEILKHCSADLSLSVGSFLREGLEAHRRRIEDEKGVEKIGNWSRKSLEEAIFAMHENIHRGYSAADDLQTLDFNAEREFKLFPGEEITIARGYSRVLESLASVLPAGTIKLGRKVEKIEWKIVENGNDDRPVKLHFCDGSTMSADHVIVTVSLGVLKRGIGQDCNMFDPPLPESKIRAISGLGFGVVDKVFLQLPPHDQESNPKIPFMQMVFHESNSELRNPKIPNWIRRTALLYPIYTNSRVMVSWFAGKEALEFESLSEEEIINGVSTTVSNLLSSNSNFEILDEKEFKFADVLRTKWGSDPLFLGSYSYVAVGSSGDDMDAFAKPLPESSNRDESNPPLQILFAGEATDRTNYSTTHGAYLSGIREANRLLAHYNCTGV